MYRIRIQGHLAALWADWFDGVIIVPLDNGATLIAGPVVDQAALHGMLNHIRDLGLPLLAVDRVESAEDVNQESGGLHDYDERTGE